MAPLKTQLAFCLLAALLAGCGSTPGSPADPDAATDATSDAVGDATVDAADGGDTTPDTAPDGGPDTAPDTAPDAGDDAEPDVTDDTVEDTAPDVVPDTSDDAAPDVVEDAAPDGVTDAAGDAATDADAAVDVATDVDPDVAADAGVDSDVGADVGADIGADVGWGIETRPVNTTCVAAARPATAADVTTERVFPRLQFRRPVGLLQAPDDPSFWYVVEKTGRVMRVQNIPDPATQATFLDLSTVVHATPSEMGLLGFAFDPAFATNRYVYASYNYQLAGREYSRIARFTADVGLATVDRATELVLLEFEQPYENHNGGAIAFGPDGFLYASFGDGGSAGDPLAYGQNTDVWFGKILRIDPATPSGGRNYSIPDDNPFAAGGGAPEIFAWGLRNVWKFSFDTETGELWAGDVGQGALEEVDLIENGGNYGWKIFEGTACYGGSPLCATLGSIEPVVEYPHSEGVSITGGYVYRGTEIPALQGRYIYGDYVSGRIWAVGYDPVADEAIGDVLIDSSGFSIASFGQDENGEIYVVNYGTGTNGTVHRLVPAAAVPADPFPERLSQTGCVDALDPSRPADGLIPYDLRIPFWSDGAIKRRWLALPEGTTIASDANGDLELPVGAVVMKTFELGGRLIETRLLMRHADGGWAGYSYAWLPDGSDAVWVRGGRIEEVEGQPWLFPSGAQCLSCHTDVAGRTLGLELAQLDRTVSYPGGVASEQIETLLHIGVLDEAPAVRALATPADAAATVEDRTHAWLHVNCAFCHTVGGPARSNADFSWHTGTMDALCDQRPLSGDLGIAGARIVAGFEPARSLLLERANRRDAAGMPPLGTFAVDPTGVALIEQFIDSGVCEARAVPEECGNGVDDDGDGAADCADPDCATTTLCTGTCAAPYAATTGAQSGSTVGAPSALSGTCGANSGAERVYRFVPATSGDFCISTVGSTYDTYLYVRTACGTSSSQIACNDDTAGLGTISRVQVTLTAGSAVFVIVDGYDGAGAYTLNIAAGGC